MNRVPVLVVVSLVLLTGCSSLFEGPSTDSPTPTVTPPDTDTSTQTVSSPTTTSTATPERTSTATPTVTPDETLAPGITAAGIVNPVALQSAHQQTMLADGFVVNVTYENVANGTVQWRTTQHTVAGPGGERALQRTTAGEPDAPVTAQDIWHNTTHTTARTAGDDGPAYTVRDRLTPPESLVWPGPVFRLIQDDADAFEVASVDERDGIRFVTLTATVDGDGTPATTATLVVDERGTVHSLEATTDYGGGDDWRVTYTVGQVGGVGPDSPAWLADVPPSASLSVHLFTDMGPEGVIQLDHTGGDAVPAGTFVTVLGNGTLYEAQLDEPLQPGETLYVFIAPDSDALGLSVTEPEAGEYDPVPSEFTVRVVTSDGVVLHEESLGWGPVAQR